VQQYHVLVVDDAADDAQVLCDGLRLHNYLATPVQTGEEALRHVAELLPDLILLDVGLPGMNGFEVCRQLKAKPETAGVPVIFVTGFGAPSDIVAGYELGAADYITKPYNLPMVMLRVESVIRKKRLESQEALSESLMDTAYTDHLTGLRNQRYLIERLQEEVEKAHRYDYPVSCIVAGIDELVPLDGEAGAAPLDDLMVEIAEALRSSSRTCDILARFDDNVFAAVLPHTRSHDAVRYARKLNNEISGTTFNAPSCPTQARLRFGIVTCQNGSSRGAEHLLGEAMRRLLAAKLQPNAEDPISVRDLTNESH
jgi:diguanylate cyclase (GGDEF)-like protein